MPSGVYKRTKYHLNRLKVGLKWMNHNPETKPFLRDSNNNNRELIITELGERDGWNCHLCGVPLEIKTATIDHLTPLALGGLNRLSNVKIACKNCNFKKGALVRKQRGWFRRIKK